MPRGGVREDRPKEQTCIPSPSSGSHPSVLMELPQKPEATKIPNLKFPCISNYKLPRASFRFLSQWAGLREGHCSDSGRSDLYDMGQYKIQRKCRSGRIILTCHRDNMLNVLFLLD